MLLFLINSSHDLRQTIPR
jgi:hypothetical protein